MLEEAGVPPGVAARITARVAPCITAVHLVRVVQCVIVCRIHHAVDADADVQVDYIIVNGGTRQAEDQSENTGAWGNNQCGGGSNSGGSSGNPSGGADPGEVWANYEFIPGERVLYLHDFEGTRVGNFPSHLDYIAGNLDVVQLGKHHRLYHREPLFGSVGQVVLRTTRVAVVESRRGRVPASGR